jgi:N-acetylglucosaminyl-diphospho-decaprenol L-rhamnosyltransferase
MKYGYGLGGTMSEVELSIVIVNWNGLDLLLKCLESIRTFPPKTDYEIIVVDNASTDGSVEWLQLAAARDARLKVIENKENLGFSKANNLAFASSRSQFLLLLNSDTEVKAGAIDRLLDTIKADPKIGACGPKLLNSDGSLQVSVWPNPPTPWELLLNGLRLYKLLPKSKRGDWLLGSHWDHSERREVPFLSGAALLVRREVIESVGGLDESYHMYHEDVEWCLRMSRGGWKLVFEPAAEVIHYGGQSASRRWKETEAYRVRLEAALAFQRQNLSRRHYICNLLTQIIVFWSENIWRGVRGIPRADVKMALDVCLSHLREGKDLSLKQRP